MAAIRLQDDSKSLTGVCLEKTLGDALTERVCSCVPQAILRLSNLGEMQIFVKVRTPVLILTPVLIINPSFS